MDEKITLNLETSEISPEAKLGTQTLARRNSKSWIVLLAIGLVGLIGGVACLMAVLLQPKAERAELVFPKIELAYPKINRWLCGMDFR